MLHFTRRVSLALFLLAPTNVLSAAEDPRALAEFVRARFVTEASSGMSDFRVCEAFSKRDDKRAFFKKALGVDVLVEAKSVESREVFVQDQATLRKVHLGILALRYPDEKIAQKIESSLAKQGGIFKATEILTKFISVPLSDSVVVIYSETVLNERIKPFFDKIPGELVEQAKTSK